MSGANQEKKSDAKVGSVEAPAKSAAKIGAHQTSWGHSDAIKPSVWPPKSHLYLPAGKKSAIYKHIRRVYVGLEGAAKKDSAWCVCLLCEPNALGIFKHSGNTTNGKKHLDDPEAELKAWHALPAQPTKTDVLAWCKANAQQYPVTCRLWRKWLAVPASSAPCERLFSTGGNVYTKKRASLDDETAEMIIFVHENMHLVRELLASLPALD